MVDVIITSRGGMFLALGLLGCAEHGTASRHIDASLELHSSSGVDRSSRPAATQDVAPTPSSTHPSADGQTSNPGNEGSATTEGGETGVKGSEHTGNEPTGGGHSGTFSDHAGSSEPSASDAGSDTGGANGSLAKVTVQAGEFAREHTVVTFALPEAVRAMQAVGARVLALRDAEGVEHALQVTDNGTATFILSSLAKGADATFDVVLAEADFKQDATASESDGVLHLMLGTDVVVGFQINGQPPLGVDQANVRGGYLHPFFTPEGTMVTGDYPADHHWHHGIWSAWARASFNGHVVDFWNSYKHEGRVELEAVERTWSGPIHAGFEARLAHVDLLGDAPQTAITEHWSVKVYNTHAGFAPYFLIELESTQTTGDLPIDLLEFEEGETYGGFAIRGHDEWRDARASFLTSEGGDNTSANNTDGRWCFIGGDVAGSAAGFAALGHPSNFRAAQRLRVHPTDPYVAFSPVKEGDFRIEAGASYLTRFRFVSTDGTPDPALFERLWYDYATPPVVTVVVASAL